MDAKQFIESGTLETYAMGLASEQEARIVVEMSARYPEVKAELRLIEESMENFDRKNAVEPPAHLKAAILSKISSTVDSSPFRVSDSANGKSGSKVIELRPQQNNFFKYAAGVALILLIGSAYYNYSLSQELIETKRVLSSTNDGENLLYADLERKDSIIQNMNDRIAILSAPGMKSIELKGMEAAPDAKAMVYANTTSGDSYLEIMSLPPAPAGMQYQFWGIVDDKPVDAGMIPLDGDTTGIHPMKNVPNTKAYAISLEPVGGSQQPTGKIYAMGNS